MPTQYMPSWASWDVPEWLSPEFHSEKGKETLKKWLSSIPGLIQGKLHRRTVLDGIVLALGLALRDILAAGELGGETPPPEIPGHITGSAFYITDSDFVQKSCSELAKAIMSPPKVSAHKPTPTPLTLYHSLDYL
jgi:hypothetical protein